MPNLLNLFTKAVVEACSGEATDERIFALRKLVNSELGVIVVLKPDSLTFKFNKFRQLREDSFHITVRQHSLETLSVTCVSEDTRIMSNRAVVFNTVEDVIDFCTEVNSQQSVLVDTPNAISELKYC